MNVACEGGRPASFSEIDLDAARDWVGNATIIEAIDPADADLPGIQTPTLRWEVAPSGSPVPPGDLPAGPVLIVAASPSVGYRSAAALARSGNPSVLLVIVGSIEDRRTLYAGASEREEAPLDTDS